MYTNRLRIFRAFSSVVRQMPGYNSQRRGTDRNLPKIFVLFYVLFVLCRSVYCLCVNVYCTTATGRQPNCSLTNISYIKCSCKQRYITVILTTWSYALLFKIKQITQPLRQPPTPPPQMKNSGCAPDVSYKFKNQSKSFGSLNDILKSSGMWLRAVW